MLTTRKNRFADVVRQQGLDPHDFSEERKPKPDRSVSTVRFRTTGLKFCAMTCPDDHKMFLANWTRFGPEFPWFAQNPGDAFPLDAGQLRVYFERWLTGEVKPYVAASRRATRASRNPMSRRSLLPVHTVRRG